ncbi:MAG: sigma 54-interacting transcriptional regulator [Planctomycetaceae bacterium]
MENLRKLLAETRTTRVPILGVVAASGQITRFAADAGADFLLALNAGVVRSRGSEAVAGYLPLGNANDQTEALIRDQVLPQARRLPVVAGVLGSDPTVDLAERFERLRKLNVTGITNWPAIGYAVGAYRRALEEADIGIESEIRMLRLARSCGFVTFGFAFDDNDAARFATAGVDALILSLGPTRQYDDLHERRERLQQAIVRLKGMVDAATRAGGSRVCLLSGGPITTAEDLEELFRHCTIQGFTGGPVFDRLPVKNIVTSTVRRFKSIIRSHGQSSTEDVLEQITGRSDVMRAVFRDVRRIAPSDINVCLQGESGTGKELVATQIHRLSHRARDAFVTLNCGAIPESLLESELFGHEKGAFTGADHRRLGKFQLAHQGTLFLDEIADLSPHGQAALLRAIQQREINLVGGELPVPVDVRIIAASNRDLAHLVREGRFREDLFYRLSYVTISIPPLRERTDDVLLLVEALLTPLQIQLNRKIVGISPTFAEKLLRHSWPGNVRELQQVIIQAALLEDGPVLEGKRFTPVPQLDKGETIGPAASAAPPAPFSRKTTARQALAAARGNKSRAARSLGVSRTTLYSWLRHSELD